MKPTCWLLEAMFSKFWYARMISWTFQSRHTQLYRCELAPHWQWWSVNRWYIIVNTIKDEKNNWLTQMLGFAKGLVMLINDIKLFLKCLFDGIWAEMAWLIYNPVNDSQYKCNSQVHTVFVRAWTVPHIYGPGTKESSCWRFSISTHILAWVSRLLWPNHF